VLAGALIGVYAEHMLDQVMGRASNALTSAVMLGVAAGFTAIIVACFILFAARINAFTAMMDDLAETRRHIDRGLTHASTIRAYRRISSSPHS
jgi:hypothetical protein